MAITDVSPFNEVDFISFCIDPGRTSELRPCCGTLFLAPMLATGTATPEEVINIATYDQSVELFGEGSIAADMVQYYFFNNPLGELYVAGLEDLGTCSKLNFTVVGTATSNGSYEVVVAGVTYSVAVAIGDTGPDIVTDIIDAINADTNAVVEASAAGLNVFTISAKNCGEQGNDINVFDASSNMPEGIVLSDQNGDPFVEGVSLAGGAGLYDLEPILEEYCNCCYDFVGVPFSDTATLNILERFSQLRHSCDKLIGGRFYTTRFNTFTDHIVENDSAEYLYGTIWNECEQEVHTPWAQTAAAVGQAHACTCSDPAEDWRFKTLIGITCSSGLCGSSCFERAERNNLIRTGGSTTQCNGSTKELEVTVGAGQYSFESYFKYPQTDYTTIRFIREFEDFLLENFSRSKLVDNISNVRTGSSAVDIPTILSAIVGWIEEEQGEYIDNIDDVINSINIERDPTNPSRINISICASIVTALRKFAIQVQPKLGSIT